MKKLYEKNEILFAVLWIVLYCVLAAFARGEYGDDSVQMLAVMVAIAAGITVFIKGNHLEEKFGLARWPKNGKRYLYFVPIWIAATGNLWGGIGMDYSGVHQLYAVLSMLLIGYVEEVIFRGFLFRAMLPKDGVKISVTVAAVTFGIGHILNLLTGQASLETVCQVVFAIAWGFLFTLVCYKSGSLLPCILAHSAVDVFSTFGCNSTTMDWVYIGATIVIALLYCPYLIRLPKE